MNSQNGGGEVQYPKAARRPTLLQPTMPRRRQRQLIAELEHDGHETVYARENLERAQDLQRLHLQERERLERMMATNGG